MPSPLNLKKSLFMCMFKRTVYHFAIVSFSVYCCEILFSLYADLGKNKMKAVSILPSTAFYPWRSFCCEFFVIGQS